MHHKLISGDNHIDLTYCPADLWSSQAPAKWKQNAPRVEERNDGQHWFVDDKDRGMWNGVGPGFLPYTKGSFGHVDEMKEAGFEWDSYPGAKPRPTTPELRIADLDRDGLEKEIIYGCLMVNDLIDDAELRVWVNARYNDLAADFARSAVDVTQASGVDGHGGSVSGAGRISLERQGVSSFRLDLHGFRLIDNEQATASATGQATINRAANGQVNWVRVVGRIAVRAP